MTMSSVRARLRRVSPPEGNRVHVVTVRLGDADYQLLKSFASLSGESMNELIGRAVRAFLDEHATEKAITALIEQHTASLRRFSGS